MQFCGEIAYETSQGGVHSDICFDCGNQSETKHELTDDHRQFLHDCLDEWFNKSKGTGMFWVGDPEYFKTYLEDQGASK